MAPRYSKLQILFSPNMAQKAVRILRRFTPSANQFAECCESREVHEELLKLVNEQLPPEDDLFDLAELFKVFGDSTRIRILFVLLEAEVCICDLAEALNMTQSAISHQLAILKRNKLVKSRREGKSVFYSLSDDHVRTIISQGMDHISEQ